MLNPPAQLLGMNGIKKFSKEILKWEQFSTSKLKIAGITNYFQINQDGGTGGGIFRKMYGEFLIEVASIVKKEYLVTLGQRFINVAKKWDKIANDLWQLSLTADISLLEKMSISILEIYKDEKDLYRILKETIDS